MGNKAQRTRQFCIEIIEHSVNFSSHGEAFFNERANLRAKLSPVLDKLSFKTLGGF